MNGTESVGVSLVVLGAVLFVLQLRRQSLADKQLLQTSFTPEPTAIDSKDVGEPWHCLECKTQKFPNVISVCTPPQHHYEITSFRGGFFEMYQWVDVEAASIIKLECSVCGTIDSRAWKGMAYPAMALKRTEETTTKEKVI